MARDLQLALAQAVQSHEAGIPVWAFERFIAPEIDIDECSEVYGDALGLFPDIEQTPCDRSPAGQCEFNALAGDDHDLCIHCGRRTG